MTGSPCGPLPCEQAVPPGNLGRLGRAPEAGGSLLLGEMKEAGMVSSGK